MAFLILDPFERGDRQEPFLEYLLDLGDNTFTVRISYRSRLDSWYMDLLDSVDAVVWSGKAIKVNALPGTRHLRINSPLNGSFIVYTRDGATTDPDFDGLGSRVAIAYFDGDDRPILVDAGAPVGIVAI